ncbi:hypothetical protein [Actinoplanes sp. NPDC049118]|uniref:hypothetical protein n=1 Tax=Actinoplanes sp. NPDC049118 TaxID=3155769 RepID=UPI0034062DC8
MVPAAGAVAILIVGSVVAGGGSAARERGDQVVLGVLAPVGPGLQGAALFGGDAFGLPAAVFGVGGAPVRVVDVMTGLVPGLLFGLDGEVAGGEGLAPAVASGLLVGVASLVLVGRAIAIGRQANREAVAARAAIATERRLTFELEVLRELIALLDAGQLIGKTASSGTALRAYRGRLAMLPDSDLPDRATGWLNSGAATCPQVGAGQVRGGPVGARLDGVPRPRSAARVSGRVRRRGWRHRRRRAGRRVVN